MKNVDSNLWTPSTVEHKRRYKKSQLNGDQNRIQLSPKKKKKKKIIVWNDMKVSKWWQNVHFWTKVGGLKKVENPWLSTMGLVQWYKPGQAVSFSH